MQLSSSSGASFLWAIVPGGEVLCSLGQGVDTAALSVSFGSTDFFEAAAEPHYCAVRSWTHWLTPKASRPSFRAGGPAANGLFEEASAQSPGDIFSREDFRRARRQGAPLQSSPAAWSTSRFAPIKELLRPHQWPGYHWPRLASEMPDFRFWFRKGLSYGLIANPAARDMELI